MSAVRPLPLRELAEALVLQPHASMEQLAQSIGVSRATLHRMVASRDELLAQVNALAYASCVATFARIGLDTAPVEAALPALVQAIQPDANLFLLLQQQGRTCRDPAVLQRLEQDWAAQRGRLEAFFRRGQQAGSIRPDLPPAWLVDVLAALINTATESMHQGRIPAKQFEQLILATLTHGISPAAHAA